MKTLMAYVSGVLFAAGLIVGGMTQPAKIIGFLDFTGDWDPSLAMVMVGALIVYVMAFRYTTSHSRPLFENRFYLPTASDIDWKLISGSVVFGVGWGLGGYCPGPGITALGSGQFPALMFVLGMGGGMYLFKLSDQYLLQPPPPAEPETETAVRVPGDG